MVPNDHTLINLILAEFHASKVGGHAGTTRTIERIGAQFSWPKMREDIKKFIKECVKISVWPKFKRGGELNPFLIFSQICFSM